MANPAANATGHLAAHGMHPCVVTHGATAGTARPAIDSASDAITTVWWVGSVAPTNAVTGDHWTDTASLLLKRYNGTSWDALVGAAWTAYTPTLTNITLGNGTVSGRYLQIGKNLYFTAQVTFGTTTTMGAGPILGLPVTVLTGTHYAVAGYAFNNVNGGNYQVGGVCASGTTNCILLAGTGSVGATVPFTWGVSDQVLVSGVYESA